jgi:beta-lactamase superfamily II metal-dependent hydrolase
MEKGNFHRLSLLAAISGVSVLTMGVVSLISQTRLVAGTGTSAITCGDVLFGAKKKSSPSALSGTVPSGDYSRSNDNVVVSSIAVSGSVYGSVWGTDYAASSGLKLGKSGASGSITITFSSSVLIKRVIVYAMCYSTSTSPAASSPFTVATSGHSSETEAFTCTTVYSVEGGSAFTSTIFDSDTVASSSFTLATTSTGSSNTLNLCKIVFAISNGSTPASSSSSSSSSAASSSSSSKAKVLSSISASGMTKTSYTVGDTLDTTGLVVTANYSDGTSSAVTGYTTDPTNGTALTVSNTSMTVSYTEGGLTKTDSVALTVNPVSTKTLVVRFKEILSSMYCDSILIKYGDWECFIDGGSSSDEATVVSGLNAYCTDHVLDVYIATHPHDDHIGFFKGSSDVFGDGGITAITTWVDCGGTYSSTQYTAYATQRDNWKSNGTNYIPAAAFFTSTSGYTSAYNNFLFTVDANVSLRFLNTSNYPTPGTAANSNANINSVACMLSAWNQRYFFCGDCPTVSEEGIIANYTATKSDLFTDSNDIYLKADHHGSKTSNCSDWLNWIHPDHYLVSAAITSANAKSTGVANAQHPYKTTIDKVAAITTDIRWTGTNGTFTYTSNGGATPAFAGTAKIVPYYVNGWPLAVRNPLLS